LVPAPQSAEGFSANPQPQVLLALHSLPFRLPTQSALASPTALHSTQVPRFGPLVAHFGVAPEQSASLPQPKQVFVVVLQSGDDMGQSEFCVHATQVFAPGAVSLQTGVPPEQLAFVVHCTQLFVVVLQTGVPPLQSPLARHCTQVLAPGAVSLQTGVPPEQLPLAVHCTQAPAVVQAGKAGLLHVPQLTMLPQLFATMPQTRAPQACAVVVQHWPPVHWQLLQGVAPLAEQLVPLGWFGFDGVPFMHRSAVHWLPSTFGSLLGSSTRLPSGSASQKSARQSPTVPLSSTGVVVFDGTRFS